MPKTPDFLTVRAISYGGRNDRIVIRAIHSPANGPSLSSEPDAAGGGGPPSTVQDEKYEWEVIGLPGNRRIGTVTFNDTRLSFRPDQADGLPHLQSDSLDDMISEIHSAWMMHKAGSSRS